MPIIRDQLGHSSLAVTDRYLGDVTPGQVISAISGVSGPSPARGQLPQRNRNWLFDAGAILERSDFGTEHVKQRREDLVLVDPV